METINLPIIIKKVKEISKIITLNVYLLQSMFLHIVKSLTFINQILCHLLLQVEFLSLRVHISVLIKIQAKLGESIHQFLKVLNVSMILDIVFLVKKFHQPQ